MIPHIHQILLERLRQHGVNNDEAPAMLRDLAKILESNPGIDATAESLKLQLLGWNGLKLDYPSFQLAQAWIEFERKKATPKCRSTTTGR
jgi:hypothetical protein